MGIEQQRQEMVIAQLRKRGITNERVLAAMLKVPRHLFLSNPHQGDAYADHALPIELGQTMSQPYIVALMAQALALQGFERVLEVGTGSGYAAAVLSLLAAEVTTIERLPMLAEQASDRLYRLGYDNVRVVVGDGTCGDPTAAPFDAIVVAAAGPWVPRPLREQLGLQGRLVMPIGGQNDQMLIRLRRECEETFAERLSGVRFVPLIGSHAWKE